ncbi:MAG: phosphocholine cytidylyltransferase family protein [Sphingomicrobium sp.]
MHAVMKAIILAAGLGSRLLPLTADRPKCLVPAGGRAILEHQLFALHEAGVKDVAVVGGYRFGRLAEFVNRLPGDLRPELIFNPFYAVSSSIGSVWAARHLLGGRFLLLNGDSIYEADALTQALAHLPAGISLFVESVVQPEVDDMRVDVRGGRVVEVHKNLDVNRARYRSLGIVACADANSDGYRSALDEVISQPGGDQRFHHDIVDLLARKGRVNAHVIDPGTWQEIDSPADIDRWMGVGRSEAA